MPSLPADDLTVEDYWGGAQIERRRLSHTALHKWLQVRVQLQKGEHICQWDLKSERFYSLASWHQLNQPSGENGSAYKLLTYTLSDPVNEQHDEQSAERHGYPDEDCSPSKTSSAPSHAETPFSYWGLQTGSYREPLQ